MSTTKQWLIFFVTVTIISAVINALLPASAPKKAFGFLCGVIIIYCLIFPIQKLKTVNVNSFFNFNSESISADFEKKSSEVSERTVKKGYESAISNAIINADFELISVNAEISKTQTGYALKKVEIISDDKNLNSVNAANIISGLYKGECEIIISGGLE